jgi:hypothetical protein
VESEKVKRGERGSSLGSEHGPPCWWFERVKRRKKKNEGDRERDAR